ncbi:TIGR02300 family protein [Phaeovulum sp. W22_SRMD_FR3]|jgi:hypothetical protein|uniref:TIGR02300 family protein n=1 Tax=Phaeovulum sp. W22_SRMD_FR3 TaxID=3240274 RepID=UPI003F94F4D1
MPKEEWGVKRLCPHCASRFYDLTKDPMTCPVCGNSFSAESLSASRGRAMLTEKAAATRAAHVEPDELADDEDIDADAADVDLDDDLLEDDEDDTVSLDDIADVSAGEDES